jgi:hypothetical protein
MDANHGVGHSQKNVFICTVNPSQCGVGFEGLRRILVMASYSGDSAFENHPSSQPGFLFLLFVDCEFMLSIQSCRCSMKGIRIPDKALGKTIKGQLA